MPQHSYIAKWFTLPHNPAPGYNVESPFAESALGEPVQTVPEQFLVRVVGRFPDGQWANGGQSAAVAGRQSSGVLWQPKAGLRGHVAPLGAAGGPRQGFEIFIGAAAGARSGFCHLQRSELPNVQSKVAIGELYVLPSTLAILHPVPVAGEGDECGLFELWPRRAYDAHPAVVWEKFPLRVRLWL